MATFFSVFCLKNLHISFFCCNFAPEKVATQPPFRYIFMFMRLCLVTDITERLVEVVRSAVRATGLDGVAVVSAIMCASAPQKQHKNYFDW